MADRSSHPRPSGGEPGDEPALSGVPDVPGTGLWGCLSWGRHGAELARVTAIDLAVLAGHVLLYPTGILPERTPSPPATTTDPAADAEKDTGKDAGRSRSGAADPAAPPQEGRAHPPVLLLHGFVDNRSAFTRLRRSLHHHGWTTLQALNYSPLTGDIRTAAEELGPHVEQLCEQSGHRRVDVVAHSLGGLIARYYVQCLGGDAHVRTLVTLGTPHSGTRAIPALAPHPLARQMRPGSEVLRELARPAKRCRTRFVAFWSDMDQLMFPVEAARIDHPDLLARNIKVSGIGHLSLPVHGSVAAQVRLALAGQPPVRGSADAA
jgi:pimeloyl-ACP methyl ester carboxylesterase